MSHTMQLMQVLFLYAPWHRWMFAWSRSPQTLTRSPLLGCLIHSLKRGGPTTATCITPLSCTTFNEQRPTTRCKTANRAHHPARLSANTTSVFIDQERNPPHPSGDHVPETCGSRSRPVRCRKTTWLFISACHRFLRYLQALSEDAAGIRPPYPRNIQLGVSTINVICTIALEFVKLSP
jgi:hypothetical protein